MVSVSGDLLLALSMIALRAVAAVNAASSSPVSSKTSTTTTLPAASSAVLSSTLSQALSPVCPVLRTAEGVTNTCSAWNASIIMSSILKTSSTPPATSTLPVFQITASLPSSQTQCSASNAVQVVQCVKLTGGASLVCLLLRWTMIWALALLQIVQ